MNISCFLVAAGPRNEADIISVAKERFLFVNQCRAFTSKVLEAT